MVFTCGICGVLHVQHVATYTCQENVNYMTICMHCFNIILLQCLHVGHGFSGVLAPSMPMLGAVEVQSADFYMPSIILWNPYLIPPPQIVPPGSIKCTTCGNAMTQGYWNDGSSAAKQPRTLHALDNMVLLVSAVYVCENRHKIVAHDERVLQLFPLMSMVPFLFLHRTGFTWELVDMCTMFCRHGMNFNTMESIIQEKRWQTYARRHDLDLMHTKMSSQSPAENDFLSLSMSNCPSNDALSECFLASFLQQEKLYIREITSIPIGQSISFDHTFKVATNVWYQREDGRWIPVYKGLFLVLNDKGQVTWQITKGTAFDEDLYDCSEQNITTIYVDKCCKLRRKIQSVFGLNVSVKLDLFHAVQRKTRTLSKKHTLTQCCTHELCLVFRCDGDSGKKRVSATPSPEALLV